MAATKSPRGAKKAAEPAKPVRKAAPAQSARAIMRGARQSPYKMRLVIDEVRGKTVNDALAYLAFSKKHAAKQIEKTLRSAVANVEQAARNAGGSLDVDDLVIKLAIVNEGSTLKPSTPATGGGPTPAGKRTSHIESIVAERGAK